MSLERLIDCLKRCGLDVEIHSLLDALWLASGDKALSIVGTLNVDIADEDNSGSLEGQADRDEGGNRDTIAHDQRSISDPNETENETSEPSKATAYPKLLSEAERDARDPPAHSILFPAARTLPDRLGVSRSLKPIRRVSFSDRVVVLDEDETVSGSASLRMRRPSAVAIATKPVTDRWDRANIVLEDDAVIDVWRQPILEFAQVMGETAAFRQIQLWTLHLSKNDPVDLKQAAVETTNGKRRSIGQVATSSRTLVVFVSSGSSRHWDDGAYSKLLATWSASPLLLLHVLPFERWFRTRLGEPQGVCWAGRPGAPATALHSKQLWWKSPDRGIRRSSSKRLQLPVAELNAASIRSWSQMLQGRGHVSSAYLIDGSVNSAETSAVKRQRITITDVERNISHLRESSFDAYRLSVALVAAPFTLEVARVVQEILLGSATNVSLLADVLLSGLISSRSLVVSGKTKYVFEFVPSARARLIQFSRESDRLTLVDNLIDRVGDRFFPRFGTASSFEALQPGHEGNERLSGTAQAFARFINGLRDPTGNALKSYDAPSPRSTEDLQLSRGFPRLLLDGYQSFKSKTFPRYRTQFSELSKTGETPEVMFVGCCEVSPDWIFDVDPGKLFVVSNVANRVPVYRPDGAVSDVSAALEYAVQVLRVKHIVVFGHSHCGGVSASIDKLPPLSPGDFLGKWMQSLQLPDDVGAHTDHSTQGVFMRAELSGIRQGVRNLMTFPAVSLLVERRKLEIHGAYLDLFDGSLHVLDDDSGAFRRVV